MQNTLDEIRQFIQDFVDEHGYSEWESPTIDETDEFRLVSIWQIIRDESGQIGRVEVYNDIVWPDHVINWDKYEPYPTYVSVLPAPTEPYLTHQIVMNMFDSIEPAYGDLTYLEQY